MYFPLPFAKHRSGAEATQGRYRPAGLTEALVSYCAANLNLSVSLDSFQAHPHYLGFINCKQDQMVRTQLHDAEEPSAKSTY
jgi:hypothetical protein